MENGLIVVKQLPVIEEQLRQIKANIEQRVGMVLSLACTETTYKEIKKARAELNKEYKDLEARRMEVKREILQPYESFEATYKDCAGDIYLKADKQLKIRIEEVENGLKQEKHEAVLAYFSEYAKSRGIDFLTVDRAGIQVTMSASLKSLKAQSKAFIDKVAEDLDMIETQEYKEEILVEYKKCFNASAAITVVTRRHEAIEAEKQRKEQTVVDRQLRLDNAKRVEKAIAEETAIISPPIAEPATEEKPVQATPKIYAASFTVHATLDKLRALKQFLEEGGYTYEST